MRFKVGDIVTIHQDIEGWDRGLQEYRVIPAFTHGTVRDAFQEGNTYQIAFPILDPRKEFNCDVNEILLHKVKKETRRAA